jgi:hypothetical protein
MSDAQQSATTTTSPQKVSKQPARKEPSYKSDLLWINHDAKHMVAAPHRHRVFSHIQRRFRPWKKLSDSQTLRANAKVPRSLKSPAIDEADDELPVSPRSLVAYGNTDPFDSYPIHIGPQENELISFYRDVFLPAQYGFRVRIPNMEQLQKRDWEACINGLRDEGVAHGSLARWGYMVGPSNPRLQRLAIGHQLKATQSLIAKLATGADPQTPDIYLHLNMLFSAETISRNAVGAAVHGQALRRMFEEAWRQNTLDYKLLLWQVHNDVQNSSIFLSKTIFDMDGFLPTVLRPVWRATAAEVPSMSAEAINADLDAAIEGQLIQLFKSNRIFWEMLLVFEQSSTEKSQMMMNRCNAQELLHLGRFINCYVAAQAKMLERGTREHKLRLFVQSYLSLAAAYLIKRTNLDPVVLGRPIFDMRPALAASLRHALEQSRLLSNAEDQQRLAASRLWALYVGSMCELTYIGSVSSARPRSWFLAGLARQALDMGIKSWASAVPVLRRFLYTDRSLPLGAEWFDEALRTVGRVSKVEEFD